MLSQAAVLLTDLLFGGVNLHSFGFATFLFSALPADAAGPLLRRAFPHFYVFVIGCSLAGAALTVSFDGTSALILGLIAVTALLTRQIFMPAINAATDIGDCRRFGVLHTRSILVTLANIARSSAVILRFSV
jgi:hypothetical protein